MISFRPSVTLSFVGLLVALAGCSTEAHASVTGRAVTAAADAAQPAPRGHAQGERGRPRGPASLADAALRAPIQLTAAQRSAVEAARSEKGATSVRKLHDTLTKEQRAALVNAITQRMDERSAPATGPRRAHGAPGHARLTRDLGLSKAQEQAITAKLEALRPSAQELEATKARAARDRTERKAALQAFVSDTFDADAFVRNAAPRMDASREGTMKKRIDAILSVLEPAQRDKLTAKLAKARHEHGPRSKGDAPRG